MDTQKGWTHRSSAVSAHQTLLSLRPFRKTGYFEAGCGSFALREQRQEKYQEVLGQSGLLTVFQTSLDLVRPCLNNQN